MTNKDRRLKIIFNTNAVWIGSGYGVHANHLLSRLLKDGWQMAQCAFTGLEGTPIHYQDPPFDKTPLLSYPRMNDVWGSDAMLFHGKHFGANVHMTFQDVWPLDANCLRQMPIFIPYVPIDKDPVPANVIEKLRYAYKIITFSKFGQKTLEKAGFASTLIPESTDVNIFKPMDKVQCRRDLNLPQDRFVFGMVGANKPDAITRKGWQQAIDAFKLFYEKHPESIFFYEINQPGGFDIEGYANHLGIAKAFFHIDPYMSIFHAGSDIVAKMLNAFDVTLHPSTTEGFGLVVIESQSCGTPVIVNNTTSMPELVVDGVTSEICETSKLKAWSPGGGYVEYADVNSLYEKMEKLFNADRDIIGKAARKHIIENYNIDTSVEKNWLPFLEELQKEILPPLEVDKEKKTI